MNTREQLLQRGIEHLKAQLVSAQAQVDTMIDLLELQGSIACGFAWDAAAADGLNIFQEDSDYLFGWRHLQAVMKDSYDESRKQAREMLKRAAQ